MNQEELLAKFGEPTHILDHGMVRVVEVMGSDAAIVQAARVSYGEGTKSVNEDRALIRYLMRHRHTSPIEMCEIKFHCKMPIFVARQWIRHRTANVNELSGRYSVMPDEMYIPDASVVALQSSVNKQGREETGMPEDDATTFIAMLREAQEEARKRYEDFVDGGLARELARTVLPLSQYTEWYWKIDLRNLLHFLSLRMDSHAQYEIRVYANVIADIVKAWVPTERTKRTSHRLPVSGAVPMTWEAFEDYVLYGVQFSRQEVEVLQKSLRNTDLLQNIEPGTLSDREVKEFLAKLD